MTKFSSLLLKFKSLIKPKECIKYLLLLLFSAIVFSSNTLFVSNISINIPESVIEIEEKLKSNLDGEQPYCLVYPKETTNFTNMAYRDPEKSSEIRSIFDNIECFDWYLDNYSEDYKPFIYDFSDGSSVYLSLCMFPKRSYVQNSFFYEIEFLAGQMKNINSPNDIVINQSFADKLIRHNVFGPLDDYGDLLGRTIPTLSRIKANTIASEYSIVGIIKNDELYNKYANNFGDFAIVPEYHSLPLPCATYVQMYENEFKNYNLIKTLLKVFKYESSYSSVGIGVRVFPIEYRTYFYKMGELISLKNSVVIECNSSIDQMFDYYYSNANLIPLIVLSIAIVALFLSFILYARSRYSMPLDRKHIVFHMISFVIALPLGALLAELYKILFQKPYSIANPLSLVLYLLIFGSFAAILFIKMKKQMKEKRSENRGC